MQTAQRDHRSRGDGSNLQSYMFWLQNGNRDEQDALSTVRDMFEDVLEQQNLSFVVSATERELDKRTGTQTVYPGNAFVQLSIRLIGNRGPWISCQSGQASGRHCFC